VAVDWGTMQAPTSRRRLLRAVLSGTAAVAGCAGPTDTATRTRDRTGSPAGQSPTADGSTTDGSPTTDGPPAADPPDAVALEPVANGFRAGVDVAFAPYADRRYVVQQTGEIRVHGPDGFRDQPFLALGDAVQVGGEKGLLGFALHPAFASNRRCYVRYSAPSRSGTPDDYSHTFVLAAFTATDDGLRARPDTERTILEIPEPQGNHNAGDLLFGPEGLLYVAVGDGGKAGDRGTGHVDDWYGAVDGGNGQDVTQNLLGSILRIDVDVNDEPYAVPDGNPLVGSEGLDEHYAWGLRNPWRMSIDPGGSRVDAGPDLYVGDVGQNRYEEVDLVRPGGNYGWNVMEGTDCYDAVDCPEETPDGEPLLDPIVEYPHSGDPVSGVSVIGGYVYRGDAIPGLVGRYVFADWKAGGRLFVAEQGDGGWTASTLPHTLSFELEQVRSFARGPDGELYVVGNGGDSWSLYRIAPA
jgi:glucose/arabinose dehydrogenase